MKHALFLSFVIILTTLIYNGCQENVTDPQNGSLDKLVGGFDIVLVGGKPVDNEDGTYTWTWSITQTSIQKKALSHWNFVPGTCLQHEDIESAWYSYEGTEPYTEIIPIPAFASDPSMDCDDLDGLVFKFNYGTKGTTFYRLILNKNYEVNSTAEMNWKAGNECGGGTFDGIGCPPPCDEWIVYGSAYGESDELYEVDLKNKTSKILYDPGEISTSLTYPNGNAYDPVNERIYFGTADGKLYYHQLGGSHVQAATGLYNIACGDWFNGKFYYVRNGTSQLYEFDGTENTQIGVVPTRNYYGDIVFDPANPGWFIGSAGGGTTALNEVVWYIYNVITKENHILTKVGGTGINTVGGVCHKQLGFGSDGVLYALDTGNNLDTGSNNGMFYTVAIDYINKTYALTEYWDSELALTDLASGPQCQ